MKKTLFILILVILSLSLFAQESIFPKEFKTKKIKITEKMTTVGDLLETLSKDSTIKFLSGENYDWRVAEREIVVVPCNEISLKSLLESVAFCTKLVWVKKDDNTYILTYDENIDLFINNLKKQTEDNLAKKREEAFDRFFDESLSDNMDKLKEEDPFNYYLNATGLKETTVGTINNIPGLKDALRNGTRLTIKGTDLSEKAINYINTGNDIVKNLMKERAEKITDERKKQHEKRNADKFNNKLPKDLSKVTIMVNDNMDNPFSNIMLGNASIMMDGRLVAMIPIMDYSNPAVKKMAKVMVDMFEDPNLDPKDAFNSIGGFDFLQDLNKDLNKDIYDQNKINIPDGIVFDEEIKLDAVPNSKINAFELLSKACGYSIVSDNFINLLDLFSSKKIRQEGTLKEIVSDINESYGLTMYMEDNTLRFYSIKWFEELIKLMPKAYYEKWGKQYSEDGFLSRENLFEMAKFSKDQLGYGFMKNPSLVKLNNSVIPNIKIIKFISSLDEKTFKDLESENGLNIGLLIDSKYNELIKIEQLGFLSVKKEGVLKLKSTKNENEEILTIIAQNKEHSETILIKLEKYTPFVFKFDDLIKNNENKK